MENIRQTYVTSEFSNETAIESAEYAINPKFFAATPLNPFKKIILLSTTVISISAVITFMAIFVNNSNKQSNIFFIINF
jgi:hypothetical protein